MIVLWSLVLWGTLFDLSLLHRAMTQGLSATVEAVLRVPPTDTAAAWGNRGCGLLAVFAWVLALGSHWSSARKPA
jgi:hypothetical protein